MTAEIVEAIKIASRSLMQHKLRSGLSVLGVVATHIRRDTFNLKYLREQPTYVAYAVAIPAFE
jgi:hypothetical protein